MATLREEQKRIARQRIIEAAATEIAAAGLADTSIPTIAERAGVSVRTVYNYFPTKDDLADALADETDRLIVELGGLAVSDDLDALPELVDLNFSLFADLGDIGAASARIRTERRLSGDRHQRGATGARTEALRRAIADARPDLTNTQVSETASIIRTVMSFETWDRLTNEFGIPTAHVGRVASWALKELLDAVRAGRSPSGRPNG